MYIRRRRGEVKTRISLSRRNYSNGGCEFPEKETENE